MHNILALLAACLVLLFPATLRAQTTRPSISLVTFGPGEELYERFGHNALRIQDDAIRPPYNDISFNYGLFTFGDNVLTDFLPGFVQGTQHYWVAWDFTADMFDIYRTHNRTTTIQELNLTREQSLRLAAFLWDNAEPQNREYVYAPYNDNCSTRVRDAIDAAVAGQLKVQTQDIVPHHTYRFHTRRIAASNPLVFICLEYILGQNVDKPITRWQEMFLPELMQAHLRTITFTRDEGTTVPAIRSETALFAATRPPLPDAPPTVLPYFIAAGVIMAAGLLALARPTQRFLARLTVTIAIYFWTALGAFAGCVALYLLFTSHWATWQNENMLQLPPLALILLLLLPWALRTRSAQPRHPLALRITRYTAAAIAACSILGLSLKLLPWFYQDNWNIIALALPVNIAVAIALYCRPAVVNEGKRTEQ